MSKDPIEEYSRIEKYASYGRLFCLLALWVAILWLIRNGVMPV